MRRAAQIRPRADEVDLAVQACAVSRAISRVKISQPEAENREFSRSLVAADGPAKPHSPTLDIGARATRQANPLSGCTIVNLAQNRP